MWKRTFFQHVWHTTEVSFVDFFAAQHHTAHNNNKHTAEDYFLFRLSLYGGVCACVWMGVCVSEQATCVSQRQFLFYLLFFGGQRQMLYYLL